MINYLQIGSLNKSFGDLTLFDQLSLGIGEHQRVGLIAKNGAGKTTLLNIIAGKEDYQSGEVIFKRDLQVAYLEQDPQLPKGITVLEACFRSKSPMMQAVALYEHALKEGSPEAIQEASLGMDQLNAWNYESRVKQILTQLNITHFDQLTDHLSGGQIKRVALANTLLLEPELLILDEPTNHLDLKMTQWLEEYLTGNRITLLMVTHDRYFLDRVCTRILEIDQRRCHHYEGNYSLYLEKRQERVDAMAAQRESDQNLYRKELEWMRRQPQARATKAKARIESFHELEERLGKERESGQVRLEVKSTYIGKKIFEVKGLSKRYGEKVILDRFSYLFARYEKMGIVGENGAGKSTFIKLLMGQVEPDAGVIDIGETVRFGYYSQEGMEFEESAKVIDVVSDIAEYIELGDGRKMSASQLLQFFLFAPTTQHNPVSKLSGGEKRRLYLCTVLMHNPNFLVLDEPTNDLDIMTLQVLEEYLQGFSGCLIVVSHDRYFLDKVVDHLLVFEGEGRLKDFPSGYSDYIAWKALKEEAEARPLAITKKNEAEVEKKATKNEAQKRKLSFKEKRELEQLEVEIANLEQEKTQLEGELNSGTLWAEALNTQSIRIGEVMALIDQKSMRWLELSEVEA